MLVKGTPGDHKVGHVFFIVDFLHSWFQMRLYTQVNIVHNHWQRFTRSFSTSTVNSLTPGRFPWKFIRINFKLSLVLNGWGVSCEISPRWMSLHLTDDKSTLVQVMAWCHQATSHYLFRFWLSSISPYGVTRVTLLVMRLAYFQKTRSIPWLLMSWFLLSPGHQQPWHWSCRINGSLTPTM